MFCNNCGAEVHEGQKFCNNCGAPIPQPSTSVASELNQDTTQTNQSQAAQQPTQQYQSPIGQQPAQQYQQAYPQQPAQQYQYQQPQQQAPKKKSKAPLIIGIVVAVVLIGIIFGGNKSSSSSEHISPNSSNDEPAATQSEGSDASDDETQEENAGMSYQVTDTSFNYYTNSIGDIEYYGFVQIQNTGTTNIYLEDCKFDLEDNDGHLLQTDDMISTCPDIIAPGETGYFYNSFGSIDEGVSLDNGVNLVPNYTVEEASGDIVDYDLSDLDFRAGDLGYPTVTGRITNNTTRDDSYLYVNVVFYDANGKTLAVTGTSVTDLNAGSTVSFECPCYFMDDNANMSTIADYKVIARRMYMQF